MDFQVGIKDSAIEDLAQIIAYVAKDNPNAAEKFAHALLNSTMTLAQESFKGCPYPYLTGFAESCATAEYAGISQPFVTPRLLAAIEIALEMVLDLTRASIRERLGIKSDE